VLLGGDIAGSLDVGTRLKSSAGGVDILLARLPRNCHALATLPPSCPRRCQICAALLARPC